MRGEKNATTPAKDSPLRYMASARLLIGCGEVRKCGKVRASMPSCGEERETGEGRERVIEELTREEEERHAPGI